MTLIFATLLATASLFAQPVSTLEVPKDAAAKDDLARAAFRSGIQAYQAGNYTKAEESLKTVPELGGFLSLYTHWFMAQSLLKQNKFDEAAKDFQAVVDSKFATELKHQAQFALTEIALKKEKWSEAERRLQTLERKWRRSIDYPEVLHRLMLTELKLSRPNWACKWARKLYVKFPTYAKVTSWSRDITNQSVEGMKLSCATSNKEFQDRVRKLQLAGESEKARAELLSLQAKTPETERIGVDMMMANFLVNEGLVDDALNQLVRYYPSFKSNFNFLTLLGRAAARAGEYQTSVGAFERAYQLAPRSKKGREALFQAAYLSYQFQDYDGAVRKFEQFIKQQPRSGLARDAQWHLAWLKYLRGDYKGALTRFMAVHKSFKKKNLNSLDNFNQRVLYWMAMSNLKLGKPDLAKKTFTSLSVASPLSYYGLASAARLEGLKNVEASERAPSADKSTAPTAAEVAVAAAAPVDKEEEESEENIGKDEAVAQEAEEATPEEEAIQPSEFKDPVLRSRIEVAQKLIEMGLNDLARWELFEVERRTRNPQYLKMLITAYDSIGSFNRSASISELSFAKDRENGGLEGAKALWMAMFPQAYKANVQRATRRFPVAQDWVWAIMRTESQYKPDIVSPVGAKGLMQLMPFTARQLMIINGRKDFEVEELFQPEVNIALGSQYLARLSQKFRGSLPLVAAAYNAGPHRVENWLMGFGQLDADEFIEHIPFLETRNYAKKVVRNNTLYRRIYAKDNKPVTWLAKGLGAPIPTRVSVRETWETL